jgi:glutamate-ammonia-ligase adenylyltransferase
LLVDICGTAPGLASYLARHSEVLDGVLAGSFFAPWPGTAELRGTLSRYLQATLTSPAGGYERALDAARRWAHEWQFRVGVHHLRGLIGAEEAGRQYADIADAVIGALAGVVADHFARRHGPAPGRGAIVLGMGSLGGRQLNAQSDLDLIVIYDAEGTEQSGGDRPLSARAYYARLTQALLTAVTAPTAAGRLYEVDMRLRPSGRQGPVATSLASFRDYQLNEAWTWEHLALTRARVVAGMGDRAGPIATEFDALRIEILKTRGTDPRVVPDLAQMRSRIFAAKAPDGRWEAKIGKGRLQDIELMAQSLALRSGAAAQGVGAQIRAGQRARLLDGSAAMQLAAAHRFLWRIQCTARLLTEGALDLSRIGKGGQEFLLRETEAASLDELAVELDQRVGEAGAIIDGLIEDRSSGGST